MRVCLAAGVALSLLPGFCNPPARGESAVDDPIIYRPTNGKLSETLASRELRRYLYLRTGTLVPIAEDDHPPEDAAGFVIARKDRPLASAMAGTALQPAIAGLKPQHYLVRSVDRGGRRLLLIVGGDDTGVLYGAYRVAEHLGVRFYMHDDVVPDGRVKLEVPAIDETAGPLFELRGIQPFHDFPEGPDWWNGDDYKAVFAQLPKLRMNFFGLHTYPEGAPNAEPTVWIGHAEDVQPDGKVAFSYPSSYQNTLRGNWGYAARPTSRFACGAALLFDRDDYGPDVMRGHCPEPKNADGANEVFNRTGDMLRDAFRFARRLGIKTCAGTETPLTIPKALRGHLESKGVQVDDPGTSQMLYEGMFTRIMRSYPLDFYWFWTPEGWTWQGANEQQVKATYADINAAIAAAKKVNAPFRLATCGWVLGPQSDRSAFDRVFPKDLALSCINRQVGMTPVEPGFADISGRDKWAIPWLEDDPALTSPQLWVGRMRRDAYDARKYGCTGLMGIHWRTRGLAPNVLALARAAWDQSGWSPSEQSIAGPVGGQVAPFPNNAIAGTPDAPLYQTVRYDVHAYRFPAPNGRYQVTLRFCEPHYTSAGVRVFDVLLEGKPVVENLDIFARVGQNKALDLTFDGIEVADGRIDIDFRYRVEFPCIAAIDIRGPGFSKKVNCGGPAYNDYEADPPPASAQLASVDLYKDWATAEFGPEVADSVAGILERVDCRLPRPSDWVDGPGGMRPDARPWNEAQQEYAFVGDLEALRPRVAGPGQLDRFDYWLNTFRYMKAMGQVRCIWGEYEAVMTRVRTEKDPAAQKTLAAEQALPIRKRLIVAVAEVYRHLLAHVSNPGEIGTVANWDQHVQPMLLDKPGEELSKLLGSELPAEAQMPRDYAGEARLIVPTLRNSLADGETLTVKVIVLDRQPPKEGALRWRPLGEGEFDAVPLQHVARGVYAASLPAKATQGDIEWHVRVVTAGGQTLHYPATAPEVSRSVVIMPPERP